MSVKPLWYVHEEPRRQYAVIPPSAEVAVYSGSPIEPEAGRRKRRRRVPDPTSPASISEAIARAERALADAVGNLELDDPMLPSIVAFAPPEKRSVLVQQILGRWVISRIGETDQLSQDPWPLGRGPVPNSDVYDTDDHVGAHWRESEAYLLDADPAEYTRRVVAPITVAVNTELLVVSSQSPNTVVARSAADRLTDVRASVEASLADSIRAVDPWRDTFLLWLIVRRPNALAFLHPLVVAVAARYGTLASQMAGIVYGASVPFDGQPLVSATAALGKALWTLDYRPSLLAGMCAFVRESRRDDGGFGDPAQPSDVLTTLVAADFLSSLDPDWDPRPTADYFARTQEPAGWWRALDPEVPWLTAEILGWLKSVHRPFAERFGWPEYQKLDRDRKTGIPGFAAFDRLARVFEELPGLGTGPVTVAFIDLAGFREFNKKHGVQRADDVLRAFAQELAGIGSALAIRDGGDEFIVVGSPTDTGLRERLDTFRTAWPTRLVTLFGPAISPVAPRMLVSDTFGRAVAAERERLGEYVEPMKRRFREPGREGILVELDDMVRWWSEATGRARRGTATRPAN